MALSATVRRFEIALSDSDREVYEQLDWRVAQHPSESERYLVARVIARCLEHAEGLDFSKAGLGDDSEPALIQRNLRGELQAWIEVGAPAADRLHKAMKAAPRVAVYTWKAAQVLEGIEERGGIYKGDTLELKVLPGDWLDDVAKKLDRVNRWELAVSGGTLYLTAGGASFDLVIEQIAVP